MRSNPLFAFIVSLMSAGVFANGALLVAQEAAPSKAVLVDGQGPGWKTLGVADFERANCDEATFSWEGSLAKCTGKPVGVLKSIKTYKNLEIVAEWRHLSVGGNSGFFLWVPEKAFDELKPGQLPKGGIEIQMLDHGYTDNYIKKTGKQPDWFTTHGDVFSVGTSTMEPLEPRSPKGSRSFPRENRSLGSPEWNHYYVRAVHGEVRLSVNGAEVSGGNNCNPSEGYLCLESEGAPIEWRNIRIRELP